MRDHDSIQAEGAPSPRGRGCMIWLGGILAGFLILLLVGAIYEPLAEAADARAEAEVAHEGGDQCGRHAGDERHADPKR